MAATAPEFELANLLLDCLGTALAENPNPPLNLCVRVGEEVRQDISVYEDECCEGLAYVKINTIFESDNFPDPVERPLGNCPAGSWVLDLEMGVFRCAPTGDIEHVATCDSWTAASQQVALDSAAMRRAVACFRDQLDPGELVVPRAWIPLGPQGACTGGTQVVTTSFLRDC